MFRIYKYALLLVWSLFVVKIFYQKKDTSVKSELGNDVIFHPIRKLETTIRHEDLTIIPDEPDTTLLSSLLNLTNLGFYGSHVEINVSALPKQEALKFNRGLEQRNYSSYTSNLIPLQRPLPDVRLRDCRKTIPIHSLPMVNVVIVFHNEDWSVLLRTVHSVLDNSPRHILQRIVLVDDASTDEVLKEPLDEYIYRNFGNVRIFRTVYEHGLMRARNLGFEKTFAPVVVFLDSHCECLPGWLEPLVARIADNDATITTSNIHTIDRITFGLNVSGGGRTLRVPVLTYPDSILKCVQVPEVKTWKRPTDPILVSVISNYVIAVSRVWFKKLGMFDSYLDISNLGSAGLSLKTWMCGGRLEIVPCSNVGYMYHANSYYDGNPFTFRRNFARVASVWLGDYKELVVKESFTVDDIGDITDRVRMRKHLHCRFIDWYLKKFSPQTYTLDNRSLQSAKMRSQ